MLSTRLGDIECLGQPQDGRAYEDVVADSDPMDLGDGSSLRVLHFERLIAIKRAAGRPNGQAVIPLLEETIARQRARSER